jgi:hypothetical protein
MIIVVIKSRLGDQLLKYMAARVLAKYHNTLVVVDSNRAKHGYYLDELGFSPRQVSIEAYGRYFTVIKGGSREYDKDFFTKTKNNIILQGLWYHYKYYKGIRGELKRELKKVDTGKGAIGIHVRRGDFEQLRNRIPCDTDYINKAIQVFKGDRYIITTDDKKWCEDNISIPNAEIISSTNPVDDFLILTSCDKLIISTSAFSWTAAFISGVPTICPEKWMSAGKKWKTGNQHCPPEWIRI